MPPTARSTPNSGCRWPSSTSRRIAARSPRSTRACSNAARCRCVATSSKAMSIRHASCSPNSSGRPSMATEIEASLPLADHAAIGKLGTVLVRRKDHGAAHVQAGPGQRPATAARSCTMHRPPRPAFSSTTTRSIRLLPLFSASAGESFLACWATRWASARLSRSKSRASRAKWSSGPEVGERSEAMRTRTRRSPNIWPSRAFSSRASQPSGTSTNAVEPRNSIRPTRLRSSPPTRSRKSKTSGLATRRGRGSMCSRGMARGLSCDYSPILTAWCSFTGPSSPDSCSGSPFFQSFQELNV